MSGSIGASKSSASKKYSGSSTETLDPMQAQQLYGNISNIQGKDPYAAYTGPMVAGFSADQIAAQDAARKMATSNTGGGILDHAVTAAGKAASYAPTSLYSASSIDPAQVNRSDVRDVTSRSLPADLSAYTNPHESAVVDTALADIERQRQIQQVSDSQGARARGAWGGDRHGVVDSLTNEAALRTSASTAASLRQGGYDRATSLWGADQAREQAAQSANQNIDVGVAGTNATMSQSAAMAEAAAKDEAARYNAGQARDAAALNLQGSQVLGGLSDQTRQNAQDDANTLNTVGGQQQQLEQAKLDAAYGEHTKDQGANMDWQALLNQALGLIPATGTTYTSGTESGKGKSLSASVSGSYGGK